MKISVITPTYNSAKTIEKCVNSVISQSYQNYEHIIIDNKSSDSTINIINEIYSSNNLRSNLLIISEKDNGISDAFNKGILHSSGDVIAMLNGDDYYFYNDVFNDVINIFKEDKYKFIHGNIVFVDEKFGSNVRYPLLCDIRVAMPYNHPTMFMRKEIYDEVGTYNPNFKFAMDFEFVCRLKKHIKDLDNTSYYLDKQPMVLMNAGGASWSFEKKTLYETKIAQMENGFWNLYSFYYYFIRLLRINLKQLFDLFGLMFIVRLWRKVKWS